MTIDQMKAGPELNTLVAERVMGWTQVSRLDYFGIAPGCAAAAVPNYSAEVPAMWETIHAMVKLGTTVELELWESDDGLVRSRVRIFFKGQQLTEVIADTSPLAVSLAALKAVGAL